MNVMRWGKRVAPALGVFGIATLFLGGRAVATNLLPRALPASSAPLAQGSPELIAQGRELFLPGCSSCHGVDGKGVTGSGPTLHGVGAASADFYLTSGRMPAVAGTNRQANRKKPAYDAAQIAALVAYVATLGPPGPPVPVLNSASVNNASVDKVEGGVLYRANCASCHQSAGGGGALSYGRHAPSLDQATRIQIVEAMRVGPGQMPVFGPSTITDKQASNIAEYVQFLQSHDDPGGISLGRLGPVTEGFVALVFGLGGLTMMGAWLVGKHTNDRDRTSIDGEANVA